MKMREYVKVGIINSSGVKSYLCEGRVKSSPMPQARTELLPQAGKPKLLGAPGKPLPATGLQSPLP